MREATDKIAEDQRAFFVVQWRQMEDSIRTLDAAEEVAEALRHLKESLKWVAEAITVVSNKRRTGDV